MQTATDTAFLDNDENSVGKLIPSSELLRDATLDGTVKYEVQDDSFVHNPRYSNNMIPIIYAEARHSAKTNIFEDQMAECTISVRDLTGNIFGLE